LRQRTDQAQPSPAAGFTLIELLVVLAILAILAVAIPSLTAGLPGVRLRAEAMRLSETMRQLHDDAIRQGVDREITFDLVTRHYTVPPAKMTHDMSPTVDRLELVTDKVMHGEQTTHIRFFADGSATDATIRLWHGKRFSTVTIDWLTGRVVQHD
jgi:type II secretion system protein H